jgi:hypothetical protein
MNLIEKYGLSAILKPEDDPVLIEMVLEATHHKFCKDSHFYFLKTNGLNSEDLPGEEPYYIPRKMAGLTRKLAECQSLHSNFSLLNEKVIASQAITRADLAGIFFEFWNLRKQFHVLSRDLDNRFSDLKVFLKAILKEAAVKDTLAEIHQLKLKEDQYQCKKIAVQTGKRTLDDFLADHEQISYLCIDRNTLSVKVCTVEYGCFPGRLCGEGWRQIWRKTNGQWRLVYKHFLRAR